jgi:hypothetical protein
VLDAVGEPSDIVAVPMSSVRISAGLTRDEMDELLARRVGQARIRQVVAARVRKEAPRTLAQDTNVAAVSSKWPPRGSPRDLNSPNRRMRIRTSGGVAGAAGKSDAPMPIPRKLAPATLLQPFSNTIETKKNPL